MAHDSSSSLSGASSKITFWGLVCLSFFWVSGWRRTPQSLPCIVADSIADDVRRRITHRRRDVRHRAHHAAGFHPLSGIAAPHAVAAPPAYVFLALIGSMVLYLVPAAFISTDISVAWPEVQHCWCC